MRRLEAGRVHEHDLGVRPRENPGDAVPRRLRFARNDADLLPDERLSSVDLPTFGRPTIAT